MRNSERNKAPGFSREEHWIQDVDGLSNTAELTLCPENFARRSAVVNDSLLDIHGLKYRKVL